MKRNNEEVGWILHKLLKTHLEKAGSRKSKSKRGLFSKLRRKTNDDLFYSAERGPTNPTAALQPTFRKEMELSVPGGVDYSGAMQPSRRLSAWNWQPSMRPDLTLYGRK